MKGCPTKRNSGSKARPATQKRRLSAPRNGATVRGRRTTGTRETTKEPYRSEAVSNSKDMGGSRPARGGVVTAVANAHAGQHCRGAAILYAGKQTVAGVHTKIRRKDG